MLTINSVNTPPDLPPPSPPSAAALRSATPPAQRPQEKKGGRTWGCLFAVLAVGLGISLLFNIGLLFGKAANSMGELGGATETHGFTETVVLKGTDSSKKIAHIDVEGVITSAVSGGGFGGTRNMVEELKKKLRRAKDDPKVAAILLRVNSPGGEVTASDVIYDAVKQVRDVKPVIVFMDSVAASGGYYIACGASEIVATPTTITGSIGVIMQTPGAARLLDKVGVEMRTFKSGAYKDTGSMSREMREDEKRYLQEFVDESYERFLGIVAEARELVADDIRVGVADGRIFSGTKAETIGLVDIVGYIEDAYARARELGGAEGAPVVRYDSMPNLFDLFSPFASTTVKPTEVKIDLGDLAPWSRLEPGMPYFLPASYAAP